MPNLSYEIELDGIQISVDNYSLQTHNIGIRDLCFNNYSHFNSSCGEYYETIMLQYVILPAEMIKESE